MNRDALRNQWLSLISTSGERRGQWVIGVALLEVAGELAAVAAGLRMLGTADAATSMGAIEILAMEVRKISEAIEHHTETVSE